MQDMQEIRDLERQESKRQTRTIKRQSCAIIALVFITIGLLASTVALAVSHAQMSSPEVSDVPAAPPVGRRLVVVPVSPSSKGGFHPAPLAVRTSPIYSITNGTTNGSSPDANEGQQCDPGSVWGGQALDELNHGYMALMQKALSDSPAGVAGEITDYYHTALQSVFRCGESMEFGQLEVVEACKSGYVGEGEKVECDEGGSYGNSSSGSA